MQVSNDRVVFFRSVQAMEDEREKNAEKFLTPAQRAEIIDWYTHYSRYIWNYEGEPLRLWADGHGFGVQIKLGVRWHDDGDINDDTVCYFSSYKEWRIYANSIEDVDVKRIELQFREYRNQFGHPSPVKGMSDWVLHPNGSGHVGIKFTAPCGTRYVEIDHCDALLSYFCCHYERDEAEKNQKLHSLAWGKVG